MVNDEFLEWLKDKYANDNIGEVKAKRGTKHNYLGMTLDYTSPGILKIDMTEYVKSMREEFPQKIKGRHATPWTENLFKVDTNAKRLGQERKKTFHTFVMKGMFLCKRGRPDIQPAIEFLSTRCQDPNENDWNKLIRLMSYLKDTIDDVLILEADNSQTVRWYVDAAFAVHKDMKSDTGEIMTMGSGEVISLSTKQKVNARSSTEAELVAVDDVIAKILWTKKFIEWQGLR